MDPRTDELSHTPRRWRRGPLIVGAVVALVAVVALAGRAVTVCDQQVGCLVVAGDRYTDPDDVPLPVVEGDGYDGQFFYRQARSPFDLSMEESNGVTFDTEVRYGRIGYPLAAWVLSGAGRAALVPWAMLAVNVAALGALGWILATAAARAGRSHWWGAVAVAVPGLWFAAGRALADPLTAALVGAAVLAVDRRRWGWAAGLFAAATLTKEQAVLVPFAYGAWRLWCLARKRRRPGGTTDASTDAITGESPGDRTAPMRFGTADLPWLVPATVFVLWQLVLLAATGVLPAGRAGGAHVVAPFTDLAPALWDWVTPGGVSEVLWILEVVVLVALAVVVVVAATSPAWQKLVAVLTVVLLVVLNDNVFVDPAHFRQFGELSVVLVIAAFGAPPRWWVPIIGANAALTLGVLGRLASSV